MWQWTPHKYYFTLHFVCILAIISLALCDNDFHLLPTNIDFCFSSCFFPNLVLRTDEFLTCPSNMDLLFVSYVYRPSAPSPCLATPLLFPWIIFQHCNFFLFISFSCTAHHICNISVRYLPLSTASSRGTQLYVVFWLFVNGVESSSPHGRASVGVKIRQRRTPRTSSEAVQIPISYISKSELDSLLTPNVDHGAYTKKYILFANSYEPFSFVSNPAGKGKTTLLIKEIN